MNIIITSSKLQYKANDGGVTRRIPEHFVKRSVMFEMDGEERRIDIDRSVLPLASSEDEVIAYIANNLSESTMTQKQIEILQEANLALSQRLYDAEKVAFDNSQTQQELLELLDEMGLFK